MYLSQLGQISLTVSELARSVPFYRDVLGLYLLFEAPPKMAFFDLDGVRLMMTEPEDGRPIANSVLYFKTDDIEAGYDELVDQGVSMLGEPHLVAKMQDHDLWMTFFHDPDQNVLALMAEQPKS